MKDISGPPDSIPIIFLHGAVINRKMWKPVTAFLDDEFRCIAIDLPGSGARADQPFTVAGAVETTRQVIADEGIDQALLAGLSLGGYIAQATAAEAPDEVAGILLSGATIRYTGWDGLSTKLYGYAFPALAPLAIRAFPKQLAKTVGDDMARSIVEAGMSARAGGQALRRLPGHDYAADLAGYEKPVLIANGERDKENIAGVEKFHEHVPHAEALTIEDAGHACALQQPAAFANAVRMLATRVTR